MAEGKDRQKQTKTGFDLNYLIAFYIAKLSGLAYSRKYETDMPVYLVYKDVMDLLNIDDERARKHKEKIVGDSALKSAPQDYWNINMVLEMGLTTLRKWREEPIHDRAQMIAVKHLKAMMEVIDTHYRETDRAINEALNKGRK